MPKPCADNHTAALSQRRAALLPNPYPIKIGNRFYSAGQVNHQSYRRRPKSRDIRRLVSHRDGSRLPGNRTESKERQMLSQMANATMRIAVAGTNSLALMISHQIITQTSHQLIILTRHAQPHLTAQGYQILIIDYDNGDSLQHAVMGVDTVISTVTGTPELALLQACVSQNVRRFAPAEFEGRPSMRTDDDPLDHGKKRFLEWLDHYRYAIESTVFMCGILYERFSPGGLTSHRLGLQTNLCNEGDYIVNCRTMTTEAPIYDANHLWTVHVCMIAAQDAARFIVRAIGLARWPREMSMAAERVAVHEITDAVVRVRGIPLSTITWHDPVSLQHELQTAIMYNDIPRQMRAHDHIATINGRYDFGNLGTLREAAPDIIPIPFETWLRCAWAPVVPVTNP